MSIILLQRTEAQMVRSRIGIIILAMAAAILAAGCSSDGGGGEKACVPGTTQDCKCAPGQPGIQTCRPTGTGFELPQSVLRERLAGFLLVDDADLNRAVRVYVEACHALSEPAGAAALAGALQARDRLRGARVGLVLSGANITVAQLRDALGGSPPL